MPAERVSMRRVREILRLKHECGATDREIARSLSVARSTIVAMLIAGTFAGLAGAIDVLGWEFRLGVGDVKASEIGFIAIAVAVLGRNKAIGVFLSAVLFGALLTGTSTRNLEIARRMNDMGFVTSRGKAWTRETVWNVRFKLGRGERSCQSEPIETA